MSVVTAELMEDLSALPLKTPSSESNFRQLDDAFLQTQARIWLGEVLKIRFDEQMNISDLLADGELLFEVSEAMSKMLPTFSMDDTQLKVYESKSLTSNKSTRRYMPYYNVDSFLRMCKNLGMDGIDLFTPSDVVEKRNTRKVCMCLRSLSKKAKLRDINVPDFDSVTCTLTMPTNKVEYIRKSLEMSQSSSSLSVEHEAGKASRARFWRRMSTSVSALSNHSSDDCDEAESRFVIDESYDSLNDTNILGSQVVQHKDDDQCEYLSPSKAESVASPCSQYYSDEDLIVPSSDFQGSRISGTIPELESEINRVYKNGDLSHVPLDWGDGDLGVDTYNDGNRNVDKEDTDTACSSCHPSEEDMCNGYLKTSVDSPKVDFDKNLELGEPPEFGVNGDFHVGETQKLSHDETLICESHPNVKSNEKDISSETPEFGINSDLDQNLELGEPPKFGINGDLYVGETQKLSHEETLLCESHPDVKSNEKDISSELYKQSSHISKSLENPVFPDDSEYNALKACTEVVNVGRESCSDRISNGNASKEDAGDQLGFHKDNTPCSIDYDTQNRNCSSLIVVKSNGSDNHRDHMRNVDHSRESNPLLLEVDSIICGDLPYTLIKNNKEVLGGDTVTCNLSRQNCDKGLRDGNLINHDAFCESVNDIPRNIDDVTFVHTFATSSCDHLEAQSPKDGDDTSLVNYECVKEGQSGISKQEDPDKRLPLTKPPRKLLKSVFKGTALVGIAVFLLHLRNNRRERHSEAKKQTTRVVKHGTPKPLQKSGSISSVYPAEKLRLGI